MSRGDVPRAFGSWGPAVLAWLAITACQRANPAYRIDRPDSSLEADAAEGDPSPDAGTDRASPPPLDLDGSMDLVLSSEPLDLSPPGDLVPADAAPDRSPDPIGDSATFPGLVAHWRLDDSGTMASDASGQGNIGLLRNNGVWVKPGFPASFFNPGALRFDGVDDYVEITNKTIPAGNARKSISLWFNPVAPGGLAIRTLIALTNDTADAGIQLGIDHGRLAAWFYGSAFPLLATTQLVDESWHHAAYTYDGAQHRLYLDGVAVPEMVTEVPKAGAALRVRLGSYQVPSEVYAGLMDDVRIYSRALEPAEVATLARGQ
jgi:hypothetical protein